MNLIGTDNDDFLNGGTENDTIEGGLGNDIIFGFAGDDSLIGGAENDLLLGGGQGTTYISVGGKDTLEGGEGDDGYGVSLETGGGSLVKDEQGTNNVVLILAENTDVESITSSVTNLNTADEIEINEGVDLVNDPNTWGDSAIELATPQQGTVGLEKSGTDLIVDINRDGVAEAENDLTIVDYFDEQGNLGAGAPVVINNIVETEHQEVVELFANNNNAPTVASEISDRTATENTPFSFTVPVDTFSDVDSGDELTYTASLSDDSDLPNWLGFDADTVSFSGTPDNDDVGAIAIKVTASDGEATVSDEFELTVNDTNDANLPVVYRFFNPSVGVHFYTASEVERDSVLENLDNYDYEGASYQGAPEESDSLTGATPVYRFFNQNTGVHLYTVSEVERDFIQENLDNWEFENIAYYAYNELGENRTPLYRFYNSVVDAHFYTPSEVEKDYVQENLPDYQLESNNGIAFYVEPM